MDNVVKLIVEVDQKAQEMKREAVKASEISLSEISRKAQEMKKDYLTQAQSRIARLKADETALARREMEQARQEERQLLDSLEKAYREHAAEWEDALFKRCVGQVE